MCVCGGGGEGGRGNEEKNKGSVGYLSVLVCQTKNPFLWLYLCDLFLLPDNQLTFRRVVVSTVGFDTGHLFYCHTDIFSLVLSYAVA